MTEQVTSEARSANSRSELLCFISFVLSAAVISTSVAYSDEDAFISFRVIENFMLGHGLRWNIDERVQVFSHPLWLLALIPIRALLGDAARAATLLSVVCSTAAVGILGWQLRSRPVFAAMCLYLPLWLSKSFTDYTNAGFENPLTYLLLAAFAVSSLRTAVPVQWHVVFGLAALGTVNRLDAALMFAPTLAFIYFTNVRSARYRLIFLGTLPLGAWLAFSTFYYGVPFPNPKYAKLDGGIELHAYLRQGFAYVADIARNDVVTCVGLLAGMIGTVYAAWRWCIDREVVVWGRIASLGCGIWATCAYVIYIGGDFMTGRHWAAPFFIAVIVLTAIATELRFDQLETPLVLMACVVLCARFGIQPMVEQRDVLQRREQGRFGIVRAHEIRDQRFNCGYYEALFGSRGSAAEHSWSQRGLRYKREAARAKAAGARTRYVVIDSAAGKTAYFAGPEVTIIDPLAITDPLLARLPDADGRLAGIGHLKRRVPAGYAHARRSGSLAEMHPALARYYAELRQITSGDLFDTERLAKIWRFNAGLYKPDLEVYLKTGYSSEQATGQPR